MENLVNLVEAILFAAGVPVKKSEILEKLSDDVSRKDLNEAIKTLGQKYSGHSGIILQTFGEKVDDKSDYKLQFASNSEYGAIVADILQPVKEKELTKGLMEVLSIIAYFQPITRTEIEELKGGTAADYALMVLTRADLIRVSGYNPTPGRPMLYSTTDAFLKRFELNSLEDLPAREDVMKQMIDIGHFNVQKEGLYREDEAANYEEDIITSSQLQQEADLEEFFDDDETPAFLKDENIQEFAGDESGEELEEIAADDAENDSPDDNGNEEIGI